MEKLNAEIANANQLLADLDSILKRIKACGKIIEMQNDDIPIITFRANETSFNIPKECIPKEKLLEYIKSSIEKHWLYKHVAHIVSDMSISSIQLLIDEIISIKWKIERQLSILTNARDFFNISSNGNVKLSGTDLPAHDILKFVEEDATKEIEKQVKEAIKKLNEI